MDSVAEAAQPAGRRAWLAAGCPGSGAHTLHRRSLDLSCILTPGPPTTSFGRGACHLPPFVWTPWLAPGSRSGHGALRVPGPTLCPLHPAVVGGPGCWSCCRQEGERCPPWPGGESLRHRETQRQGETPQPCSLCPQSHAAQSALCRRNVPELCCLSHRATSWEVAAAWRHCAPAAGEGRSWLG